MSNRPDATARADVVRLLSLCAMGAYALMEVSLGDGWLAKATLYDPTLAEVDLTNTAAVHLERDLAKAVKTQRVQFEIRRGAKVVQLKPVEKHGGGVRNERALSASNGQILRRTGGGWVGPIMVPPGLYDITDGSDEPKQVRVRAHLDNAQQKVIPRVMVYGPGGGGDSGPVVVDTVPARDVPHTYGEPLRPPWAQPLESPLDVPRKVFWYAGLVGAAVGTIFGVVDVGCGMAMNNRVGRDAEYYQDCGQISRTSWQATFGISAVLLGTSAVFWYLREDETWQAHEKEARSW